VTFTSLINLFVRLENAERAYAVFEEMKKAGIQPNVVTFNSLIHLFVHLENAENAYAVFEEMKKAGILPNDVTFHSLIDVLVKTGSVDKAKVIFKEQLTIKMEKEMIDLHGLSHGAAYIAFLIQFENEGITKPLILITGKGLHERHEFLALSHFLQSKIGDNHPELCCRVDDSNQGRLIVEMKGT
jgi:pentatricopeptide repeat protein